MTAVDPAIVRSHIAKIGALASQHPHLCFSLEGICSVLDTAISLGVPPVGQPAERFGNLEISCVTFRNQPYVVVEWPEALANSADIDDLIKALERESISSTHPEISPRSLILIGLWAT